MQTKLSISPYPIAYNLHGRRGCVHSLPSGSLAMTTPAPPAPPNGANPVRIAVKMTSPFAFAIALGGIFRNTFLEFFFLSLDLIFSVDVVVEAEERSVPLAEGVRDGVSEVDTGSSVTTPSTACQLLCEEEYVLCRVRSTS